MSGELNNLEEPDEVARMLANDAAHLANGSSGHTLAEQVCIFAIFDAEQVSGLFLDKINVGFLFQARAHHSSSPRRIPLFERASARWWNPQFVLRFRDHV